MEQDVRKMLDNHSGRYLLVNAISQRVRALQSGYKPLVARGAANLDAVATEEFRQGRIRVSTLSEETKGTEGSGEEEKE